MNLWVRLFEPVRSAATMRVDDWKIDRQQKTKPPQDCDKAECWCRRRPLLDLKLFLRLLWNSRGQRCGPNLNDYTFIPMAFGAFKYAPVERTSDWRNTSQSHLSAAPLTKRNNVIVATLLFCGHAIPTNAKQRAALNVPMSGFRLQGERCKPYFRCAPSTPRKWAAALRPSITTRIILYWVRSRLR